MQMWGTPKATDGYELTDIMNSAIRHGQAARRSVGGSFPPTKASMLANSESAAYLDAMNSKHRKTLAAVFTDPVSGTIEWAAVESLLLAAGARLIEGSGSRVRFEKDGEVGTFHRPHPAKEAKRYQVRDARDFLERIGVRP